MLNMNLSNKEFNQKGYVTARICETLYLYPLE
ncbi:hypothetical protein CLMAG_60360 [Clostridium magnum DSM 2767]|uniref:Uncharacterized protein n=1 Tax=Clostridium magnum DSM 2767 TaxID=1121326 RepID=A0A162QNB8_9CLOT|nr:hypothetical protein CLMAG_59460 [Clostridium magnum DSM 2767]KZL88747.1 hypothetical protein CLMAG_60360 [Clostridium magnum DSM 2767]